MENILSDGHCLSPCTCKHCNAFKNQQVKFWQSSWKVSKMSKFLPVKILCYTVHATDGSNWDSQCYAVKVWYITWHWRVPIRLLFRWLALPHAAPYYTPLVWYAQFIFYNVMADRDQILTSIIHVVSGHYILFTNITLTFVHHLW